MPGGDRAILHAGAPGAGTSEVVTVTVSGSPTSGTYKLKKDGIFTASIAYSATSAALQAVLNAHPSINMSAAGANGGPYTLTATGNEAAKAASPITLGENSLAGGSSPTVQIVETTPGVDATGRGAPKGQLLVDTTNGIAYINTGTETAPTWTKIGTQS